MKEFQVYIGRNTLGYEVKVIIIYILFFCGVTMLNNQGHQVYLNSGSLINVFAIMPAVLQLCNFCTANKKKGDLGKFFYTIPNGYATYKNAYKFFSVINIIRPLILLLITYLLQFVPLFKTKGLMYESRVEYAMVIILMVTFPIITGLHVWEVIVFLISASALILTYYLQFDQITQNPVTIVLTILLLIIIYLLTMTWHLRKVKVSWSN